MLDFFHHGFNTLSHGFIGYIIPFLFVLTIVVFFHELGHFLVARWNGVKVLTFSLGFGPELAGFNDRLGTRWKISAIPLGGYVKFFGDDSEASTPSSEALATMTAEERKVSFHHQGVAARAAIVAAGPIANFILAIVIFTCMNLYYGKSAAIARIDVIQANTPAADAGFRIGDIITSVDGKPISNFSDLQRIVSTNADSTLRFSLKRDGADVTLEATPALKEIKDSFGNTHKVGILGIQYNSGPTDPKVAKVGVFEAVTLGVDQSWFIVTTTFRYVGSLLNGTGNSADLGGPIRIAQISGQAATLGFQFLLNLCATLSVSIGLLNLFPVPLLDGGHLLFYGVEAARGRPLSERAQEVGFRIGLGLVLMLMVFATYNDILHLAAS